MEDQKKFIWVKALIVALTVATFAGIIYALTHYDETSNPKTPKVTKLEPLEKYDLESGHLFKYVIGKDTVYLIEGASSAYPVTMSIKSK
jgi:uncharacterized protein YgiM (DUF1202 family)